MLKIMLKKYAEKYVEKYVEKIGFIKMPVFPGCHPRHFAERLGMWW